MGLKNTIVHFMQGHDAHITRDWAEMSEDQQSAYYSFVLQRLAAQGGFSILLLIFSSLIIDSCLEETSSTIIQTQDKSPELLWKESFAACQTRCAESGDISNCTKACGDALKSYPRDLPQPRPFVIKHFIWGYPETPTPAKGE
jgi:hypothetical protein